MIKKLVAASLALAMLAALIPVSFADSGDVKPYNGWIGADSPLYSIKILFQKIDVSLTFNNTDKMNKQLSYADERLAEARAMELANNSGALEAALDNYDDELNDLNQTAEAPDINDTDYNNLQPALERHEQFFYDMMNNSTVPEKCRDSIVNAYNQTLRLKKGMPFITYNNTTYFIPPGQLNKYNSTHIPPGLAKKGYIKPVPSIDNGSIAWPWDRINYSYNTANATITIPTMPPMPQMGRMNGHGNGNNNGNGNDNANGLKK